MNKEDTIKEYIERISRFVTEDELETICQTIQIVEDRGIRLYTSVLFDAINEAYFLDESE